MMMPSLKAVREERRLSQQALAAASGIDASRIRAIEDGEARVVSSATQQALAQALGVAPHAIDEFRTDRGAGRTSPTNRSKE